MQAMDVSRLCPLISLSLLSFITCSQSLMQVAETQIIRLRSSVDYAGRVEIYDGETWGTVCDDQWDMDDAAVVCRQLGCSGAVAARSSAYYGQGLGTVMMRNVQCLGSESKLQDCKSSKWKSHDHTCNHSRDAGVECVKNPTPANGSFASLPEIRSDARLLRRRRFITKEGPSLQPMLVKREVRLVGGISGKEGRLEIFYNGRWGSVCNYAWGVHEANVVCRQLSYNNADILKTPTYVTIFPPDPFIWLDHVNCDGSETSLTQCLYTTSTTGKCSRGQAVGVVCVSDDRDRTDVLPTIELNSNEPTEASKSDKVLKVSVGTVGGIIVCVILMVLVYQGCNQLANEARVGNANG